MTAVLFVYTECNQSQTRPIWRLPNTECNCFRDSRQKDCESRDYKLQPTRMYNSGCVVWITGSLWPDIEFWTLTQLLHTRAIIMMAHFKTFDCDAMFKAGAWSNKVRVHVSMPSYKQTWIMTIQPLLLWMQSYITWRMLSLTISCICCASPLCQLWTQSIKTIWHYGTIYQINQWESWNLPYS